MTSLLIAGAVGFFSSRVFNYLRRVWAYGGPIDFLALREYGLGAGLDRLRQAMVSWDSYLGEPPRWLRGL